MQVDVKAYDRTTDVLQKTYTDTLGDIATEEMNCRGLSFSLATNLGNGDFSVTIWDDEANVTISIGDVLTVTVDSSVEYRGTVVSRNVDHSDINPYYDRVTLTAKNELFQARDFTATILEDNEEGSDKTVSTNIQAVYTYLFEGTGYGTKFTGQNFPIETLTKVTYDVANNTLPSYNVDVEFNAERVRSLLLEMLDFANGTLDLSTVEPYIYFVDTSNAMYTKQRSTSVIGTFDLGDVANSSDFIYTSDDLEDYKTPEGEAATIKNMFVLNHTEITTNQYSTEVTASRSAYGTQPYTISDDNVSYTSAQLSTWLDGFLLRMLSPITTYRLKLKKQTYGFSPWFPSTPDGYIKITKDSGATTVAQVPFISASYKLDSGGWNIEIICGETRPKIYTKRLYQKQNDRPEEAPDTTPPTVQFLDHKPAAYEKTYKQVISPMYLAATAKDDNGISSVQFYLSKWNTGTSAWLSYSLMGSGTWQAAPDSENEGYYELSTGSGYYDLEVTGGLSRGDIFRVKTVATDPAGNKGVEILEYQLDEDAPNIYVSIEQKSTGTPTNAPSVMEVAADFRLKIQVEDLSTDTVTVSYSNSSITVNAPTDSTEPYYITDDITKPNKGEYKVLIVTVTNEFGKQTKSVHYVKGIEMPAAGVPTSIRDHDTSADDTTATVPQFTDKIEFSATFKDPFYTVDETADEVYWRIYNAAGTLVKTIKDSDVNYVVSESNGTFTCQTDISTLSLGTGFYSATCILKKKEKYIDETGTTQTGYTAEVEGAKAQFEIVGTTAGYTRADAIARITVNENDINTTDTGLKDRMDVAEQETFKVWNDGFDDLTAKIRFNTTTETWQYTDGSPVGSPTYTDFSASPNGTTSGVFTINYDDSTESNTYLVFKNGGTNQGAIKFNDSDPSMKVTTNYQDGSPTWTNITTGASNLINDTYSATLYELKVNSSDGSVTFTEDPSGTPVTLFKIDNAGAMTVYGDLEPDTDDVHDLGAQNKKWANAYVGNYTYTLDLVFSADGGSTEYGSFESDATNNQVIPVNVAIGFKT